jgi:hypothetical protein
MSENIEVELDGEDDLEIEVQDDTPAQDQGKPKAAESEPAPKAGADDDDLEGYSDSVKKRINKLKFDFHAERRAKEEAARLREEAISYAEKVRKENESLRKAYAEGETVLVSQTKARVASELDAARKEYKSAYESGDADAVLAAQEKMIRLQSEHQRVEAYKPRAAEVNAQTQSRAPQQAAPQVAKPDDRAMKWAEKNAWFMKDKAMTGFAMGLHEDLVGQGIDPASDLYYSKIDDAVRRTFPDRFDDGQIEEKAPRRQTGPVVAPAARSTKAPRKVVLTSTEAALAKRLGVPLKVFAAQKLKDMTNG